MGAVVFGKVVTDVSKDLVALDEALHVQFDDDGGCITVHRNVGKRRETSGNARLNSYYHIPEI